MKNAPIACLSICLLAAGCGRRVEHSSQAAQPQKELKPVPPTPIAEKREEIGGPTWDPAWDRLVEANLPPELLSPRLARDVRSYCPRFATMSEGDKRAYWAYFFQALAGAEAGLKPTTDVQHTEPEIAVEDTVTRRMVRSEGLLQLTYMDASRYGCDFNWEHDKSLAEKDPGKTILRPENNLICGIKILKNQLIDRGRPLFSRSSYWSTLQPGRPSYLVFAKQMANVPAACRAAAPMQAKGSGPQKTAVAAVANIPSGLPANGPK